MNQVSSTKKLLSASAIMASGTLISRVLGMLRVMLIAFILGNGTRQADILGIATMVPNALYILFAGGALNTVLVPQIVRAIKNDDDGGEAFTNRIMTAFMLIIGVVAVVITVAAPVVTTIYSDAAWRGPALSEQYASMVALTYLTLPQIFFYGAFFLLAQILNARDKFGPMMWAPIANNVISILVLSLYLVVWGNDGDHSAAFSTGQILLLGIGSTLGIAVQAAVLLPFLKQVGFKLRPRFDLRGTGLGHTFSLTKWTLGFVAVNQLALVVVNRLATTATAGGAGAGVNVYSNAHLLWILPHSLVTTSLATAMLPNASRLAAGDDQRGVAQEMTKTVRLALIFIVPATTLFLSLSQPTAHLLFGHGQGASDASWVGWALMAFAIGLVPFTIQFVCLRTYYALEDTRTPFLLQIGIAAINAVGALLLVWWINDPTMVAAGLALSYSIAYVVGVFVSWQLLRRKLPDLQGKQVAMHVVRLGIGAVPSGVLAWFLADPIRDGLGGSMLGDLLAILAGGILILGGTLGIGKLLHVRELGNVTRLLRTRGKSAVEATPRRAALDDQGSDDDDQSSITATQFVASFADDDPPTMIRNRPPKPGTFEDHEHSGFRRPEPSGGEEPDEEPSGDVRPGEDEPSIQHTDPGWADEAGWEDPAPAPSPLEGWDSGLFRDSGPLEGDEGPPADDELSGALTKPVPPAPTIGEPGAVLGARYQLAHLMRRRTGSETWLAHDQVLSRDIVAHIMAAGDPNSEALLAAARRGAAATDSRFLRVLDVDELIDDPSIGVYAICEHSAGQPLAELLEHEPLDAGAGAFIAREVADALSTMHAQGLFHEHLDPDHILITPGGGVRILGFGVESVLQGDSPERPWSQREAADVVALAAVLRATQNGVWDPGADPADGLPLADVWQDAFDGRIATMAEFVDALPDDDASAWLEGRMTLAERSDTEVSAPVAPPPRRDPQPEEPATDERRPRYALWALILLAVLTLVVSLLVVALTGRSEDDGTASPGDSPTAGEPSDEQAAGPLEVVDVTDFDPEADGGNGEELPDEVANVIDGDPETTWTTMRYLRRANLGGLKPGVGFVLDLGEPRRVSSLDITVVGEGPTDVELRVPAGEEPSMETVNDWQVVAPSRGVPAGEEAVGLNTEVDTQYVLVYLTNLPPIEGGYAGEVAEVVVHGGF